jgi:hypothetical protein
MTGLPEADAATRSFFLQWLETFSSFVRDVDYPSARPLFHNDILAFGTHRDVLPSLEAWVSSQWDNVWPRTDDFRFDLATTHRWPWSSRRGPVRVSMRTAHGSTGRGGRPLFFINETAFGWGCIRTCR